MTTLCDPLSHKMDIDEHDIPLWKGRCTKCDADLIYKWGYDEDQYDKADAYFNSSRGQKYLNYDLGSMSDYQIDSIFAVLSDVDNDFELEKGVFIIPYTSVTIIALKDGVQTTTTDILNPTYNQLKSKDNQFGDHTSHGFREAYGQTDDQFNKAWQKVVRNDSWLKKTYSGSWNAINIKRVADKFRPRKV